MKWFNSDLFDDMTKWVFALVAILIALALVIISIQVLYLVEITSFLQQAIQSNL